MFFSKLGWPTSLAYYHAKRTIAFKLRTGSTVPLDEFAKSLVHAFRAHPFLPTGHLQTFWTVAAGADIPIYYGRKIMTGKDGGTFTVDFVVEPSEDHTSDGLWTRTRYLTEDELGNLASDDTKPMLIAFHGLTGGSHESYLRAVLEPLISKEGGFAACVMNARGCAKSKITSNQLFNGRYTADVRQAIQFLRETFPNRPLFAVAFSLGANILANYLGEEGDKCILKGAALCSNPWNLEVACKFLHNTFLGSEVYSRALGRNLKDLFEGHVDIIQTDPRIDVPLVRKSRYIWEFDRDLTSKAFGYATVGAYYRDASSVDRLLNIQVPTFILHALDDPVAVKQAIPFDEVKNNPYCFMCTTSAGGHLSWFEPGGSRWFAKPMANFFKKIAEEVEEVVPVKIEPEQARAKL